MSADGWAGVIATIIASVALAFVDQGWLVSEWASQPHRMIAYTFLALSLGYGLHALMSAKSAKERHEEDARRAEEQRRQEEERRRKAVEAKRKAEAINGARRAEGIRDTIEGLDEERVILLATAYTYGIVERDYDTRDAVILKGMAKLGLVKEDGVGVLASTWKLTPDCRCVMDEMERDGLTDMPD